MMQTDILDRVAALERRVDRYRNSAACLLVLLAIVVTGAAYQEGEHARRDRLRAERFEVAGAGKRTPAILGKDRQGNGELILFDAQGKEVHRFSAAPSATPPVAKGRARSKIEARRALKKGMSEEQVRQLLGEPDEVNVGLALTFWKYTSLFGGRVSVTFGADSSRVKGWDGL